MLLVIQFKRLHLQQQLCQELLVQLETQDLPQWQREQIQHFLHHLLILVKLGSEDISELFVFSHIQ